MLHFCGRFLRHFSKFVWTVALMLLSVAAFALVKATLVLIVRGVRDQNFDFDEMFGSLANSLKPKDWY